MDWTAASAYGAIAAGLTCMVKAWLARREPRALMHEAFAIAYWVLATLLLICSRLGT